MSPCRLLAPFTAFLLTLLPPSPSAHTQIMTSGDVFPGSPTNPTWNPAILIVGEFFTGSMTIFTGGTVSSSFSSIGYENGSNGSVIVSGGSWISSTLEVGRLGNGTLTIENGGSVSNSLGFIGTFIGSNSTVTVDNGTWTNTSTLHIGHSGDGILNLDSGTVSAVTVSLGTNHIGAGTLNLNGGTLTTQQVGRGNGLATFNFNGGTLRLSDDQTNLFDGFVAGIVTLDISGGTLDTQTFNVATSQTLTGSGSLTKEGSGTLTLTGNNTYSGDTVISAGTLMVSNTAGSGTGSGNVTVHAGARIGGSGSISGNLTLQAGAQLVLDPLSPLSVSGSVALDNSFSIASLVQADGSAIDWTTIANGTFTLIALTTSDFSNISNFGPANAADIGGGRQAYFQNGSLELVVVPEPSTYLLLTLGLLALIASPRFRKSRPRVG